MLNGYTDPSVWIDDAI